MGPRASFGIVQHQVRAAVLGHGTVEGSSDGRELACVTEPMTPHLLVPPHRP